MNADVAVDPHTKQRVPVFGRVRRKGVTPAPLKSIEQSRLPPPRLLLRFQRPADNSHNILSLLAAKFPALRQSMPFQQTRAATGSGGMLRHKHRMPAHRRLLPVIPRLRRRQPLGDDLPRMLANDIHPPLAQIQRILSPQSKSAAKLRLPQRREQFIQIPHRLAYSSCSSGEP
jgi:hypothetical protein